MAKNIYNSLNNKRLDPIIEILIESDAIKFGCFVTKSNTQSPYFINTSMIYHSRWWVDFVDLYVQLVLDCFSADQVIGVFGSAYKGIPLACTFATLWFQKTSKSISFSFDRKEQKTHGEQGKHLGLLLNKSQLSDLSYPSRSLSQSNKSGNKSEYSQLTSGYIVIDDVLTSGLSLDQSFDYLSKLKVPILGGVTAVDRNEYFHQGIDNIDNFHNGKKVFDKRISACNGLQKKYNLQVKSLININQIYQYFDDFSLNSKQDHGISHTNQSSEQFAKIYHQFRSNHQRIKQYIDDHGVW